MRTIVLGLGNAILSDDSVGLRVVREVGKRLRPGLATVVESNAAGLGLLDELNGYDSAVIVDAVETGCARPGHVSRLDGDSLNATRNASSPHDVDFATALELGRRLGMSLPGRIALFGVEIADGTTFSEECTSEVGQAIPRCAEMVVRYLEGGS